MQPIRRNPAATLALVLLLVPGPAGAERVEVGLADVLAHRKTSHGAGQEYDPAPLDQSVVRALVEAGISAPSGGDQRSLDFYIITDRKRMDQIRSGHPYATALLTAPCVIVIAGDEARARYPELHDMDAGLAAMAVLVQATQMNLTTCVLSIAPQGGRMETVRAAASMPKTMRPVLMVAVGRPATDATTGASVGPWNPARVHTLGP